MADIQPSEEIVQSSTPADGVAPEGEDTTEPKGRTAEDRINELLSKNKELAERLEAVEVKTQAPPPPPPQTRIEDSDPKVQEAINFLKKQGKFVDEDFVRQEIQGIQNRMAADNEHMRLENNYTGADGRPKYSRVAIEDYARKTGIWNFEAAYNELYRPELTDWTIKKAEADRKKRPYIVRPSSTEGSQIDNQTITREKIEGWLKTPEGRMKYEQNREKIFKLMAENKL